MDPDLLTVDQAREVLGGVSRATISRLAAEGALGVVKVRGRRFVERNELRDFVQRNSSSVVADR